MRPFQVIDLNNICDPKWHLKCPRNFRPPPWILPKIFIFYTVLTYTIVIPSSKQKHTTGSANTHSHSHTHTHTHTHTHWHATATTTNKTEQLGTSHRLLMVISLIQTLFKCAKFRPLRVIIKGENFADWLWRPACFAPTMACFKHSL